MIHKTNKSAYQLLAVLDKIIKQKPLMLDKGEKNVVV
jgi:hypothetical protein